VDAVQTYLKPLNPNYHALLVYDYIIESFGVWLEGQNFTLTPLFTKKKPAVSGFFGSPVAIR